MAPLFRTSLYAMFAEQHLFNIINLAHVNEIPIDEKKPEHLIERLCKRIRVFEPETTAIVRRAVDNAGLCQLGSASTAALFPSRKALAKQALARAAVQAANQAQLENTANGKENPTADGTAARVASHTLNI